jgi:hypothetical protein
MKEVTPNQNVYLVMLQIYDGVKSTIACISLTLPLNDEKISTFSNPLKAIKIIPDKIKTTPNPFIVFSFLLGVLKEYSPFFY